MIALPGILRKPQLDALRAIAVSAVLIHHFLPVGRFIPEDFLTLGALAVRLFFVLSGYLITGILLRSRELTFGTALKQFYLRRALRIFPIYYLVLLTLVLVGGSRVRQDILWHLMYLSNILFVRNPGAMGITGHLWTLSVEEQFYFIWPFLILLVPNKYILRVILVAIVIGVCWTIVAFRLVALGGPIVGGILTPACLDSLGIGSLLSFIENDQRLRIYRERFLRFAVITGGFIILLQTIIFFGSHLLPLFFSTAYLGVSLVFVWLVGRAAQGFGGKLGAFLEWRPLLYIGKISYGVYLYHNFMPRLVSEAANALGLSQPGTVLTFLFASALTFLVAAASWHLIERPINRLKEQVSYSRRKDITRQVGVPENV